MCAGFLNICKETRRREATEGDKKWHFLCFIFYMSLNRRFLFLAVFVVTSMFTLNSFARVQTVLPTKRYVIKDLKSGKKGKKLFEVSKGQPIVSEKCGKINSKDKIKNYCRIRIKRDGETYKFFILTADLRLSRSIKNIRSTKSTRNESGVNKSQSTENNRRPTATQTTRRTERISFMTPVCGCKKGSCRSTSGYGNRKSSRTGRYRKHHGDDISGLKGTPVIATESGTITKAHRLSTYGKVIYIKHGSSGYETRYAHLSKIIRTSGYVRQGETIGYIGSTGRSTGNHLHYEIRKNGQSINPGKTLNLKQAFLTRACPSVQAVKRADVARRAGRVE